MIYDYYHWIDTSDVEILFPDGSLGGFMLEKGRGRLKKDVGDERK
jgi:hypothetical protein